MIRDAFQPAYIHRDGEAVSRSTQLVYRGIRGSLSGSVGQRDLHDADLNSLIGMDFNIKSRLSEVLQVSQRVERDEQGRISVFMGALNAKADLKGFESKGIPKNNGDEEGKKDGRDVVQFKIGKRVSFFKS